MRIGIENFFLEYAIQPLRDNPEVLRNIVSEIVFRDDVNYVQEDVGEFFDIVRAILFLVEEKEAGLDEESFNIIAFSKIAKEIPHTKWDDLSKRAKLKYEFITDDVLVHFLSIFDIAYQTVHGCNLNVCRFKYERQEKLIPDRFKDSANLKCYECDQLHFVNILSEIVSGKELPNIDWFEFFMDLMNNNIFIRPMTGLTRIKERKGNFYWHLQENEIVVFPLNFHDHRNVKEIQILKEKFMFYPSYGDINGFRLSLVSAAFYSLITFLMHDDRRKLKLCHWCKKFFIALRIDPRRKYCDDCSRKNKMTRAHLKNIVIG